VLGTAAKCWLGILHMGRQDLGIECYEWQVNKLKLESWVKKLKVELD
jgi:hypothetical protein